MTNSNTNVFPKRLSHGCWEAPELYKSTVVNSSCVIPKLSFLFLSYAVNRQRVRLFHSWMLFLRIIHKDGDVADHFGSVASKANDHNHPEWAIVCYIQRSIDSNCFYYLVWDRSSHELPSCYDWALFFLLSKALVFMYTHGFTIHSLQFILFITQISKITKGKARFVYCEHSSVNPPMC